MQIYVQPIPASGAKRQISSTGGTHPRWSRDGKELFYLSADSKMMVAPLKPGGATFEAGAPQALFANAPVSGRSEEIPYQPSPDGKRFLAVVQVSGAALALQPVTIWLNWQAGFKR